MLGASSLWIVQAVASLAHSSGPGWILHPGSCSSAPHSPDAALAAHLAAHCLVAHSFVIGQSRTNQPVDHPTASDTFLKAIALVAGPLLAGYEAMALAWMS